MSLSNISGDADRHGKQLVGMTICALTAVYRTYLLIGILVDLREKYVCSSEGGVGTVRKARELVAGDGVLVEVEMVVLGQPPDKQTWDLAL